MRLAKRSRGPAGSLHRTQTISQEAIAELVVCGRWASARERVRKFGKFQLQGRKMGSYCGCATQLQPCLPSHLIILSYMIIGLHCMG